MRQGQGCQSKAAPRIIFELAFTTSEFLLDFGQAYGSRNEAVIHTRILMTPVSAKTLTTMLQNLLEQYEKKMGSIKGRAAEQD
jgi:Protein of unknown function (DUF3467)